MIRKQKNNISRDLAKKMVLIVGPRQVGKTWLAKEIMQDYNNPVYLNFDHLEDRKIIKEESWLPATDIVVFDELHKMKEWKTYLKGLYDTKPDHLHILVTGSARLDTFSQAGDSLAGRYFLHHLFPFSYKETSIDKQFPLDFLISRGGFPEPLLAENEEDIQRWRSLYADSLIREDILNFENIQDLRSIQLLFQLLRSRVGSPISYKSLSEDIDKSPNTVKKFIQTLEALYIVFRVTPFSRDIARSLKKEPKLYFFDTGMVNGDEGIKFENYMAVSLLKHVNFLHDSKGKDTRLHYLRTKEKREVDFCLVENEKPVMMVETKFSDTVVSPHLYYFNKRYSITGMQVVLNIRKEKMNDNIAIRKAENFLLELDI